ncbi:MULTISPECIES: cation transporter [unclassified Pseudoalteromonas]|uniref:cation transporter n=1 Tax=Pseudoalteromonas TaxID=53246 RepID=UPI003328556D
MSKFEHKVGVSEVNLVVRYLKLTNVDGTKVDAILHDIDTTFGVNKVSFEYEKQTLHVSYDATHCSLQSIKNTIKINGADISYDWWTNFKEGYYEFVDKNIRENAKHKPWSCHASPPGSAKSKKSRDKKN